MYKAVIVAALVAVANAGYLGAPLAYSAGIASPALVSQQSNILRTPGNLGQVSTYSKTINTPYSSVSKSDVRVSNDALVSSYAPALSYASPIARVGVSPLGLGVAPVARVASPIGYGVSPLGLGVSPLGRVAAPVGIAGLGVAYSAAPVVSHVSLDGLGLHVAY